MAPCGNDNRPHVMATSSQLLAKLKWEVACERRAFAMDPRLGIPTYGAMDLEDTVRLVQAALEEVRKRFTVYPGEAAAGE